MGEAEQAVEGGGATRPRQGLLQAHVGQPSRAEEAVGGDRVVNAKPARRPARARRRGARGLRRAHICSAKSAASRSSFAAAGLRGPEARATVARQGDARRHPQALANRRDDERGGESGCRQSPHRATCGRRRVLRPGRDKAPASIWAALAASGVHSLRQPQRLGFAPHWPPDPTQLRRPHARAARCAERRRARLAPVAGASIISPRAAHSPNARRHPHQLLGDARRAVVLGIAINGALLVAVVRFRARRGSAAPARLMAGRGFFARAAHPPRPPRPWGSSSSAS